MNTIQLIHLKLLLEDFKESYSNDYPLSSESADDVIGSVDEILTERKRTL